MHSHMDILMLMLMLMLMLTLFALQTVCLPAARRLSCWWTSRTR